MNSTAESVGPVDIALRHAERLLSKDAALAAEQASEILKVAPGHPLARLILGAAQRVAGRFANALDTLEALAVDQPSSSATFLELGVVLGAIGQTGDAIVAFRRALHLNPKSADGWRLLADQLGLNGDACGADYARARHLRAATHDPRLIAAAAALVENQLPLAESRLRSHLDAHPTDVAAMRMLAEVAARLRRYADAQALLERCLQLSPSFDAARHNYAVVLNRQGNAVAALPQIQQLLDQEPGNPSYRNLKAAILANLSDYAGSIEVYESVLSDFPHQPKIWMSLGHSLKTAGRPDDSVATYRRAIMLQGTLGEAYWSLANLKTFRFEEADLVAMNAALQHRDLSEDDRLHFHFALGKAYEDDARFEISFEHYALANGIRRKQHPYSADENTSFVQESNSLFTSEFLASREGGFEVADPIFVVGLPRSGSTLIEQILASHSLVEGTMELPHLPEIARELSARASKNKESSFFDSIIALSTEERRALGERYLAATRVYRKGDKPFFIDKMPNNWLYIGLIQLILPNAKIIDARRHPLGCGLSVFKQHFARGQNFSYDLVDIGRHYRDYVRCMAHFDTVLPGRVHRTFYESMIDDIEGQVRALLNHCGLTFEDQCLRYYENQRAVRTASSEQVRQPIFRAGLDQWRHYEAWLGPLKDALGTALECYPSVPRVL